MHIFWNRALNYLASWAGSVCRYFIRFGDALSQLFNVAIFFSENPNESVSGRCYRQKRKWFWGKMLLVIDWCASPFEEDHCKKSHEADVKRAADLLKSAV